jgi:hypothetical protein
MPAKFSRPEEDNAGNSRSPRKEEPSERVNNVQTNSHRNMLARGCAKASPRHRRVRKPNTASKAAVLPTIITLSSTARE